MLKLNYPAIDTTRGRKSPTGRTLWCGPFAVAVITGLGYDEAYAKVLADIRRAEMAARKKKYAGREADLRWSLRTNPLSTVIKGTYEHQIARILTKLGVTTKLVYSRGYGGKKDWPTLLTFTREHTVKDRVYILVAGHHWITICNGILYHSHHDPMPVEDAPKYRLARIECWAEVRPRPSAVFAEPVELSEAA